MAHEKNFAKRGLFQIFLAFALSLGLVAWQWHFLYDFLFGSQSNLVGRVMNGSIIGAFLWGAVPLIMLQFSLIREQRALEEFANQLQSKNLSKDWEEASTSLIGKRFKILKSLAERRLAFPLAQMNTGLRSKFSRSLSFPRFINQILVLLGMLGTIISLAMALVGASDLLKAITTVEPMGTVVNSMSSALSTTMAGVCHFILFRFIFGKVQDSIQHFVGEIENFTSQVIVPLLGPKQEAIQSHISELLVRLTQLVDGLHSAQSAIKEEQALSQRKLEAINLHEQASLAALEGINQSLKMGFRLREESH